VCAGVSRSALIFVVGARQRAEGKRVLVEWHLVKEGRAVARNVRTLKG